ncbi:hypothetical protein Gohar_019390 [Gossypium harknessii]|uniref:Prolamin-like domain-containing protein n=2 Tax=Gossypium TaxID=3633 RepID=A0A7J9BBM9_GOSGO|nr:hypothetical protein [Gossypium gossypioides]MBA0817721.1 hypothetical protein [Gossypium harknessii]
MASLDVYAALVILAIALSGAVIVDSVKTHSCGNMTLRCIDEVYTSIFRNGTVSDECCHKLVKIGRPCHEALVRRDLEDPFFKNHTNIKQEILSKAKQIWNKCTSIVDAVSVSPNASP